MKNARLLYQRQGVVERIGRHRVSDGVATPERRTEEHREKLIRAVAREDHAAGNGIDSRGAVHELVCTRRRIKPQPGTHNSLGNCTANAWRRRIRILIGIELDQALPRARLLAGQIWSHLFDRFAKHATYYATG
jgi:hypothetical protein